MGDSVDAVAAARFAIRHVFFRRARENGLGLSQLCNDDFAIEMSETRVLNSETGPSKTF